MAEATNFNIHSICRICLEYLNSENIYDLFVIPGLAKKLQFCTSLSVEPLDGFPKNLCNICYARLNELHDFQKQCVDSVQKFQDMIAGNDMLYKGSELINDCDAPKVDVNEDDKYNFDPLLNHKMELIEEEEVFKMLEHVDKDIEEKKDEASGETKENTNDFDAESLSESESDNDEDFIDDMMSDKNNESDDDLPLMLRIRKSKEVDSFKNRPGPKPKRKRIPASERHLHTIIDCEVCHKKFKKVTRYQEHMKTHSDTPLPYPCTAPDCTKSFTTANGLRLHARQSHIETVADFLCPEEGCGRTFSKTRLLNWHLKNVHKIAKELNEPKCFPCTECEKVFRCQMALKKHMYKHDGKELPFPCNICGKRFVVSSALKEHLMRHAGIKNYVCPYCGVGKTTRQEWNTHVNTHTQEKKFQCHLCPHTTYNKQNLRMHVKIVHDKIKNYACQYCGKTFGKSTACKMHEMTHNSEKRHECKVCGKRFLYPKGLTKHLKTHEKRVMRAIEVYSKRQGEVGENGEALESVSLPGLMEAGNKAKEDHVKFAEEILKAFAERTEAGSAANTIPPVAVSKINFMMKEGAFVCSECGQGFNSNVNLKRHHRSVHESVKNLPCRFCPKRFSKPQTLKHHEMTHTGEKPHGCDQCGKRFIQLVALKLHMKVHMKKPSTALPSTSVFDAQEELQMQEIKKLEEKRKAEDERAEMAEAAKVQLKELKIQQDELKTMEWAHGICSSSSTARAVDERLNNPKLGEFTHVNTSTMGTRTIGVNDA